MIDDSDECSSKFAPPSKRRRSKGKGSGWIECKPIKRCGKEYQQYWYHYEEWREGDRVMFVEKDGEITIKKVEGVDWQYLQAVSLTLEPEWLSDEDERAYADL